MSSVFFFHSTEVPFQSIGGRRDFGIVNKVKQVWYRANYHTRCKSKIAEHPTSGNATGLADSVSEALIPLMSLANEVVSLCTGLHHSQIEEQFSEMLCIGAFGISPTPTQSLALNMDNASLKTDLRPLKTEILRLLGISINGGALRV
jgi:hypothetical protein